MYICGVTGDLIEMQLAGISIKETNQDLPAYWADSSKMMVSSAQISRSHYPSLSCNSMFFNRKMFHQQRR